MVSNKKGRKKTGDQDEVDFVRNYKESCQDENKRYVEKGYKSL